MISVYSVVFCVSDLFQCLSVFQITLTTLLNHCCCFDFLKFSQVFYSFFCVFREFCGFLCFRSFSVSFSVSNYLNDIIKSLLLFRFSEIQSSVLFLFLCIPWILWFSVFQIFFSVFQCFNFDDWYVFGAWQLWICTQYPILKSGKILNLLNIRKFSGFASGFAKIFNFLCFFYFLTRRLLQC